MTLSPAQVEWYNGTPRHWQQEAQRRFDAVAFYLGARSVPPHSRAADIAADAYGYSVRSIYRWARSTVLCGNEFALFLLCPRNECSIRPLDLGPYQIEEDDA